MFSEAGVIWFSFSVVVNLMNSVWPLWKRSALQCMCLIPLRAYRECFSDGKAFGALMFTQTQHAWMCLFIASKHAIWHLLPAFCLSLLISCLLFLSGSRFVSCLPSACRKLEVWAKSEKKKTNSVSPHIRHVFAKCDIPVVWQEQSKKTIYGLTGWDTVKLCHQRLSKTS